MAGASGGRSLEQTPTWAVAVVCFVLVTISIIIEYIIHLIGKWFRKKNKRALYEALEKIKSELMLLGFISLLLTVGGNLVSKICIPASVANTWHPCSDKEEEEELHTNETDQETTDNENRRRLLALVASSGRSFRRALAAASTTDKCAAKGKVPFVSEDGIHQLHIFIFVLAVFHILYSVLTMALGRAKMKSWKKWEKETRTIEYQFSHDPERFRFARETSFGRRHLSFWTKTPVLIWIPHQFQVLPQHRYDAGDKSLMPQKGPSASKVLAVLVMLPVGGTLLAMAGITLTGTIFGLCVTTPLFIIFSPVIVPAALVLGLAVTGFFASGAFGLTALSSLSWVLNNLRQKTGSVPEMADQAKKRVAGMAEYVGQKTKEVGQEIQTKAHETTKTGKT